MAGSARFGSQTGARPRCRRNRRAAAWRARGIAPSIAAARPSNRGLYGGGAIPRGHSIAIVGHIHGGRARIEGPGQSAGNDQRTSELAPEIAREFGRLESATGSRVGRGCHALGRSGLFPLRNSAAPLRPPPPLIGSAYIMSPRLYI